MSRPVCYIGVAFFNRPSFPTQWALILSGSPLFEGPGYGSTVAETVNGVCTPWVSINGSPASFNPLGHFLGIISVGQIPTSLQNAHALISSANQASAEDRTFVQGADDIPWGSEKYVVLALLRLHEGRCLTQRLPRLGRGSLAHFIGGRIRDLLRVSYNPGSGVFPVVTLESGQVSFGQPRR